MYSRVFHIFTFFGYVLYMIYRVQIRIESHCKNYFEKFLYLDTLGEPNVILGGGKILDLLKLKNYSSQNDNFSVKRFRNHDFLSTLKRI